MESQPSFIVAQGRVARYLEEWAVRYGIRFDADALLEFAADVCELSGLRPEGLVKEVPQLTVDDDPIADLASISGYSEELLEKEYDVEPKRDVKEAGPRA